MRIVSLVGLNLRSVCASDTSKSKFREASVFECLVFDDRYFFVCRSPHTTLLLLLKAFYCGESYARRLHLICFPSY